MPLPTRMPQRVLSSLLNASSLVWSRPACASAWNFALKVCFVG